MATSPLKIFTNSLLPIEQLSVNSETRALIVKCLGRNQIELALEHINSIIELAVAMDCIKVVIKIGNRVQHSFLVSTVTAMENYLGKA